MAVDPHTTLLRQIIGARCGDDRVFKENRFSAIYADTNMLSVFLFWEECIYARNEGLYHARNGYDFHPQTSSVLSLRRDKVSLSRYTLREIGVFRRLFGPLSPSFRQVREEGGGPLERPSEAQLCSYFYENPAFSAPEMQICSSN